MLQRPESTWTGGTFITREGKVHGPLEGTDDVRSFGPNLSGGRGGSDNRVFRRLEDFGGRRLVLRFGRSRGFRSAGQVGLDKAFLGGCLHANGCVEAKLEGSHNGGLGHGLELFPRETCRRLGWGRREGFRGGGLWAFVGDRVCKRNVT